MADSTLRWDLTDGPEYGQRWIALVQLLVSGRAPAGLHVRGRLDLSCVRLRSLPAGLTVTGDLDLRQCERLRRLGAGLQVGGDLTIGGRGNELTGARASLFADAGLEPSREGVVPLRTLPDDLRVGGTLTLHSCHRLTSLPASLHLGRSLELIACRALTALPAGLHVPGSLTVRGRQSLAALPADLRIGGSLLLQGAAIETLPDTLRVPEDVTLVNCRRLRALPSQLGAQTLRLAGSPLLSTFPALKLAHLRLERLPALRALPPDLQVSGRLQIKHCPITDVPVGSYQRLGLVATAVQALPEQLVVEQRLYLQRNPLTSLPRLAPAEDLVIEDCAATTLPTGLRSHNVRLTRLPIVELDGLSAAHELRISACPALRRVGATVEARSLLIHQCPQLSELPTTLQLGNLSLVDCPSLARLPQRLTIENSWGRTLSIEGCSGIEELPAQLVCPGEIEVAGSGLRRLSLQQAQLKLTWRGRPVPKDRLLSAVGRGEDLEAFFRGVDIEMTVQECLPFAEQALGRKLHGLRRVLWRERGWRYGKGTSWNTWHFIAELQTSGRFGLFTWIGGDWSWVEGDRDSLLATVPDDLFERATTGWLDDDPKAD